MLTPRFPFTVVLLAITALNVSRVTAAETPDFLPPSDAGVVDVKTFGAKGDGVTDDTAAIRTAIESTIDQDRYAAPAFIYLPAGEYLVSGPIEGRAADHTGWSSGWRAGFQLVGQSRGKSVLRLTNNCAGYGDATKPQWVVATGSEADGSNESGGGNRAFRHAVMNLTIDVGAGNPGAIALDFIASNRGTVENVRLKSSADSGRCGLRMTRGWPGPALVKDLEIQGFAIGVDMSGGWQYSMTFDGLTLINQREVGFWAEHNPVFVRRAFVQGSVTAFKLSAGDGLLVLHDAVLTGTGAPTTAALELGGIANLRDVTCTGFATVLDDHTATNQDVAASEANDVNKPTKITERYIGSCTIAGPGAPAALKLPVLETPTFWPTAPSDWVNGAKDLQAAIDSGKPVVYLPRGHYELEKTLIIAGQVRKLIGMQSSLKAKPGVTVEPLIRFTGAASDSTILEHLWLDGVVEHAGAGTLTIRHCDLNGSGSVSSGGCSYGLRAISAGRTFIEDVIGKLRIGKGHALWARQINAEFGEEPLLVNQGGRMWLFGFKTEGQMTALANLGGESELLGGLFYPLADVAAGVPLILNDGGRFSGTWVYNSKWYPVHVRQRESVGTGAWTDVTANMNRGPALYSSQVQTTKN